MSPTRLSGLARQALALHRALLRAARAKPEQTETPSAATTPTKALPLVSPPAAFCDDCAVTTPTTRTERAHHWLHRSDLERMITPKIAVDSVFVW